jgi:phage terminase large subunit-like protein
VVACGRRFGKTETGKILIIEMALRGGRCWWLAPTYTMASQVWRDLKSALRGLPGLTISESEHRMDLPGGGMLAIRSTHHPDNLRGAGLDYAVLDEAAFMEPGVWPGIVRPMLAERRGGAAFLSTPYGRNWFWELFKLGLDPEEAEWASFHYRTADNPLIAAAELDAIRRSTPERVFREEYLAEFIDDAGQVFRGIREAATAAVDAEPVQGRRYVAGVDWGREVDYTCIAIIDADSGALAALDRFNRVGWAVQRDRLKTLCAQWQPVAIWAEENSIGAVNIEALQAEGLPVRPFQTTARSKAPLIEGLALAIERGELSLLPDDVLLGELASYGLERLPGGGYRYGAPPGAHDDTVMALALAWHGVKHGGVMIDFG